MVGTLQAEGVGLVSTRERHRQALQRLQAKQGIIADLIAGRLGLLEATARFRAVQQDRSEDDETLCRTVLGWLRLALSDRPERAEALSAALQRSLDDHLSRPGGLRLPDA
jgi:hypothetical protein